MIVDVEEVGRFNQSKVLTAVAVIHPSTSRTRRSDVNTANTADVALSSNRHRRDVFHGLYNMMKCTTQCDPLSYKGYGCYCGFLGSGQTVDAIDRYKMWRASSAPCKQRERDLKNDVFLIHDRCCKKHDYCYGATSCRHQSLIYFVPYKWKCNGGHPYCGENESRLHFLTVSSAHVVSLTLGIAPQGTI